MSFYDFFTNEYFSKNNEDSTVFSYGILKDKHYIVNTDQENRLKKFLVAILAIMFLPIVTIHSSEFILLYLILTGTASHFIINHEIEGLPSQDYSFDDRIKGISVKQARSKIKMMMVVLLLSLACIFATSYEYQTLPNPSYNKTVLIITIVIITAIVKIVRNIRILRHKNRIENDNR